MTQLIEQAFAFDRAQALAGIAATLAQAGRQAEAAAVATQAEAVAQPIEHASDRARALAEIAQVWSQTGQHEQAFRLWRAELGKALSTSYSEFMRVLGESASSIAPIDRGQTLWKVYEAVREVESWWGR